MKKRTISLIALALLLLALAWVIKLRADIKDAEVWTAEAPTVCADGLRVHDTVELVPIVAPIVAPVDETVDAQTVEVSEVSVTETAQLAPTGADEHTDEVWVLATVFAGECYPDDYEDMLKVGMCCYNRVDSAEAYFPDTLYEVVTQPNQVFGYFSGNVPHDLYIEAAREVVDRYYAIKAGLDMPWDSSILYWCAGGDGHNHFRATY